MVSGVGAPELGSERSPHRRGVKHPMALGSLAALEKPGPALGGDSLQSGDLAWWHRARPRWKEKVDTNDGGIVEGWMHDWPPVVPAFMPPEMMGVVSFMPCHSRR